MERAVGHQSGNVLIDCALMVWSWIIAALQWMDLQTLNSGVGIGVGVLTIILLCYRIYLAHLEVTQEVER